LNHALDALDDRNGEQSGGKISRGNPVAVTAHLPPLDFNRAERCDDGGSLELLVPVEDQGGDAGHDDGRYAQNKAGLGIAKMRQARALSGC